MELCQSYESDREKSFSSDSTAWKSLEEETPILAIGKNIEISAPIDKEFQELLRRCWNKPVPDRASSYLEFHATENDFGRYQDTTKKRLKFIKKEEEEEEKKEDDVDEKKKFNY